MRDNLNSISETELAEVTIEQKLATAEFFADEHELTAGTARDQWVLAHASWNAFLQSKQYKTKRIDGLEATFAVEKQLDLLKKSFDEITKITGIDTLAVTSTAMFDPRPEDPKILDPEIDV